MPSYQHWSVDGLKRRLKPIEMHPVARELCMSPTFVGRARAYWWSVADPTPVVNTGSNWPPGLSARPATSEYWHLLITKTHQHAPHLLQPEPTSLEQAVQLALDLSSANPMLRFDT